MFVIARTANQTLGFAVMMNKMVARAKNAVAATRKSG